MVGESKAIPNPICRGLPEVVPHLEPAATAVVVVERCNSVLAEHAREPLMRAESGIEIDPGFGESVAVAVAEDHGKLLSDRSWSQWKLRHRHG